MSYTDKELLRASKLAYYVIDTATIREIDQYFEGADLTPTYTLSEFLNHSSTFRKSVCHDIKAAANLLAEEEKELDGISDTDVEYYLDTDHEEVVLQALYEKGNMIAYQKVEEIYNIIDEIETGALKDWKVVSFCYNNDTDKSGEAGLLSDGEWAFDSEYTPKGNGFVSVTFETHENNAIVAFRGSNGMEGDQLWFDWVASDFGLILDGENTVQQDFASQYMADYILHLDYDNLAMTGHSLGGNLAMHSTLSMFTLADADTLPTIQTVGYDSPGFSNDYISRYALLISIMEQSGKVFMNHHKWSVVGAMLNQFSMTNDWYARVYSDNDVDLTSWGNCFNRHDMAFVELENDYVMSGFSYTPMELFAGFTDYIERYPKELRPDILGLAIIFIDAVNAYADISTTGEYTVEDFFEAFDIIISFALNPLSLPSAIPALGLALMEIINFNTLSSVASAFVDNFYNLQKMCIDGTDHDINDNFGVNTLLFPCGVASEDVKVHLLSENDAVELRWGEEDNQYIVIQNFNNEDNNTRYNLLFHNNYENGTLVPANHPTSPFRTIYGSALGEPLAPIYDDQYPTTIYGEGGDDYIFGASADDIIDGGEDNDTMLGNGGNDTYIIYRNSGSDVINDSEGSNVIVFKDDITADELSTSLLDNGHVLITIENGGTIELADFQSFTMKFEGGGYVIEKTDDNSPLRRIHGTEENETISPLVDGRVSMWGYGGDDRLNGGDGIYDSRITTFFTKEQIYA